MKSKYRYLIPNSITFISLICGIVSILLAAIGNLYPAGVLILASFVLDLFDGAAARQFRARSEFGLHLDSLVDMVSLGTAPAVLIFMYLQGVNAPMLWAWPVVIFFPLAGAFRLARFNLLPPKKSGRSDSAGLTISSGGATLALAVLSDLATPNFSLPPVVTIMLVLVVCLLMISTIPFPSFSGVFSSKRKNIVLILLFAVSLMFTSFFNAWFLWNNTYLGVYLARAGYRSWK